MANEIKALNIGGTTYTIQPEYSNIAGKVNSPLKAGTKSYNGSAEVTITASDLGLSSALKYIGTSSTKVSDGGTESPTINGSVYSIPDGSSGQVVFYDEKEFVWNGSTWEFLGDDRNFKVIQSPVSDPVADSATSTTFIDAISQDANGLITATKKRLPSYLSTSGGTITASNGYGITINSTLTSGSYNRFHINNIERATVGYYGGAAYIANENLHYRIGVTDDGTPVYRQSTDASKQYTLLHSGNISTELANKDINGYLRAHNYRFIKSDGSWQGMLIVDSADTNALYYVNNAATYHNVLHSGNIGEYAMKVNPSNINLASDTNVAGYGQTADGWPVAGPALLLSNIDGRYAMMLSGRNGVLRFNTRENGTLTDWKTIAFTDSNVASATKLQTARTIWGQSFDGTGDVSGSLTGTNFLLMDRAANPYLKFTENGLNGFIQFLDGTMAIGPTFTNSLLVNNNGNVTISGSCSASSGFFETSDSRLKDFKDPVKVDLDKLSKLTKAYFTFKNNPEKIHLGVSAQEIQEIYPEIVNENEEGFLSVDYAKLSVIALTAVDELNNRLNSIEERLSRLEK